MIKNYHVFKDFICEYFGFDYSMYRIVITGIAIFIGIISMVEYSVLTGL